MGLGCGKSVMAGYLQQHLGALGHKTLFYRFQRSALSSQSAPTAAAASLIFQLLATSTVVPQADVVAELGLLTTRVPLGPPGCPFKAIWTVAESMMTCDPGFTLIMDALDEGTFKDPLLGGAPEFLDCVFGAVQKTRVLNHDEPWVVIPRGLVDEPEPLQVVSLARAVARIALGVPFLEEMPPTHVEAYLIAAARVVAPAYGTDDIDVLTSRTVGQYEAGIAKALSRKQRRQLEEIAAHLPFQSNDVARVPPAEVFVLALTRAEVRAAFVVSGDLLATVDEIRRHDPMLQQATERPGPGSFSAILEHPLAGDVCRFALSPEATALRRRIGSIWT